MLVAYKVVVHLHVCMHICVCGHGIVGGGSRELSCHMILVTYTDLDLILCIVYGVFSTPMTIYAVSIGNPNDTS